MSVHQRYMLEMLRNVGCLRRDQMRKISQQHFQQEDLHITENRLDAMLRQLRNFVGSVRLEGDLVRLDNFWPSGNRTAHIAFTALRSHKKSIFLEVLYGKKKRNPWKNP